ncbi:hypothetical protein [Rickettsiella massiliensis]|uniref:hypothetical protein n=1 Tax=Rickettsiella massiliensis TaxID=676517 RepID=UPI00192C6804|nr:hypothetical protein [Rickettsiella massiliensis]
MEKRVRSYRTRFSQVYDDVLLVYIEFGLIQTGQGLRIYGAGLISSRAEANYALTSSQKVLYFTTRIDINLR